MLSAHIERATVIADPNPNQMPALVGISMIGKGCPALTELTVIGNLDLATLKLKGFSKTRRFCSHAQRIKCCLRLRIHFDSSNIVILLHKSQGKIEGDGLAVILDHRLLKCRQIVRRMLMLAVVVERLIESRDHLLMLFE
jgi:hypothetical protein